MAPIQFQMVEWSEGVALVWMGGGAGTSWAETRAAEAEPASAKPGPKIGHAVSVRCSKREATQCSGSSATGTPAETVPERGQSPAAISAVVHVVPWRDMARHVRMSGEAARRVQVAQQHQ